ncbi:hypothetical protein KCP74_19285 [Salmonella enterica subsp. enterica]|nr:hypothetical protein KCP74_19285 [Salmonella enterica subsp. enterica]
MRKSGKTFQTFIRLAGTIRSDLRYFQKSGMLRSVALWRRILNRDALNGAIRNKIDISSTIATPIHQDAKLRRKTQKAGKVCFRLHSILMFKQRAAWNFHKAENHSGQSNFAVLSR